MLGCTGAASVAAFWVLLRDNGLILDTSQRAGSDPGDTLAGATPASFIRATAAPEAPLLLQNVPTATPFPLPEPTLTSAPTPTATPVVVDVPAAADTPTPLPTQPPTALPTETALPPTATEAPARAQIQHVVIISIDGLRPDALELADAPVLDGLKTRGTYSPNAKAVMPSHTMANHASMLGGMVPDKHGVFWDILYAEAPRVKGPTLFNVAHDAGLSTMMVVGKPKLEYLVLPNSVDKFIGQQDATDTEVKNQAVELIKAGLPNVMFVHLPDVDRTGHDRGWMSPEQLQAVAVADSSIGEIVAALEGGGYLPSTLLIVTSDHGGHDGIHGTDSPEDTTIVWLAVGPGVPAGVTLSSSINTYDTAATALYALNLPIPGEWDGKPVLEIFN